MMTFQVQENCSEGEYDISLSLTDGSSKNFSDEHRQALPVTLTSGTLNVREYRAGDVDNDGEITSVDLVKMANHVIEKTTLTGKAFLAADVDEDDVVTVVDCVKVAQYLAKMIETLE